MEEIEREDAGEGSDLYRSEFKRTAFTGRWDWACCAAPLVVVVFVITGAIYLYIVYGS